MKRFIALTIAGALVAPFLGGCSDNGHDAENVRSTKTTTRIEPDGDRVTKTTTVKQNSSGDTVRTSKTTTVDR
jgi:hypothetical protein